MEIEERLQRLRDHCEEQDLEFFFSEVSFFTEEERGWYVCSIDGAHVATEEGMGLVITAAEEYLGISDADS